METKYILLSALIVFMMLTALGIAADNQNQNQNQNLDLNLKAELSAVNPSAPVPYYAIFAMTDKKGYYLYNYNYSNGIWAIDKNIDYSSKRDYAVTQYCYNGRCWWAGAGFQISKTYFLTKGSHRIDLYGYSSTGAVSSVSQWISGISITAVANQRGTLDEI